MQISYRVTTHLCFCLLPHQPYVKYIQAFLAVVQDLLFFRGYLLVRQFFPVCTEIGPAQHSVPDHTVPVHSKSAASKLILDAHYGKPPPETDSIFKLTQIFQTLLLHSFDYSTIPTHMLIEFFELFIHA